MINKRESTGLKYLSDSNTFIEYSYDMDDIYKNIEEHNPKKKKKRKILAKKILMIWLLICLVIKNVIL